METNWYETAKYRYPRKYMTINQLEKVLNLGLISLEQFKEIKTMSL